MIHFQVLKMLQQNTLFMNYEWFVKAAAYVHENLLSKPYNNGINASRWQNQRTIVLLSNKRVVDVPPKYLFGIAEAIDLSNKERREKKDLVTLKEIIELYNEKNKDKIQQKYLTLLTEDKIGELNVALMEQDYSCKILKVVHRPNHDTPHSIRVAAYIPVIQDLFSIKGDQYTLTDREIEKLQLMMLFSVVGREDETGFSDNINVNEIYLYQAYRAVDAIAFLKYCLQNWEHYQQIFDSKEDLYECALVVELMGHFELPELSKITPTPIMTALLGSYSEGYFEKFKKIIELEYPNCNKLRNYLNEDLEYLFYQVQDLDTKKLNVYLKYMNAAHESDLMRCYPPGDYKQEGGCFFKTIDFFYDELFNKKIKLGNKSNFCATDHLVDYLVFSRRMLNIFGEKTTTNIIMGSELDEVKKNLASVEDFLYDKLSTLKQFTFNDIKNSMLNIVENDHKKTITFEKFLEFFEGEEKNFLMEYHFVKGSKEKITYEALCLFIVQYITKLCTKREEFNIFLPRFYFVSNSQDPFTPIYLSTTAIDDVPKPLFIKSDKKNLLRQTLYEQCGEGVTLLDTNENLYIEFASYEIAKKVIHSLEKMHLITREILFLGKEQKTIVITKDEYDQLQYFLKFKPLTVAKQHSVEDYFIDENGDIAPIELIENYRGVICLHSGCKKPEHEISGIDYFFSQLENPMYVRPFRNPEREYSANIRKIIYDQENFDIATQKKKKIIREVSEEKIAIEHQRPILFNPLPREYWADSNKCNQIPRKIFAERGLPRNTIFTKKTSHALMMPNGKQIFFAGTVFDFPYYFPVGILSDIREMHLKGERFIWNKDANTTDKFWVGDGADSEMISLGLPGLREYLKKHVQRNQTAKWNELLIGASKTAVKAFVCVESTWTQRNNSIWTNRLNTILQAKLMQEKYGIHVPLLIADGKNTPYLYTEKSMKNDIAAVINLLKEKTYPYFQDAPENQHFQGKLICVEQALLLEFFKKLTNIPCHAKLKMYDEKIKHEKNNSNLNYEVEVHKSIEHNSKILADYVSDFSIDIPSCLSQLNLLGGENREKKYFLERLEKINSNNCHYLLIRNIRLGHEENINIIFEYAEKNKIAINFNNAFLNATIFSPFDFSKIIKLPSLIHNALSLLKAVQACDQHSVAQLLNKIKNNVDPSLPFNTSEFYISHAFKMAVTKNSIAITMLLLNQAKHEISTTLKETAFMIAATSGRCHLVELLLNKVGSEISAGYKASALLRATVNGHKAIVALLLDCDEIISDTIIQALLFAATKCHQDIVELILDKVGNKITPSMKNILLKEFLMHNVHQDLVELLLDRIEHEISPNDKVRAFFFAVQNSEFEIIELLLKKIGQDISVEDKENAKKFAEEQGKSEIVGLIDVYLNKNVISSKQNIANEDKTEPHKKNKFFTIGLLWKS